MHTFIFIWYIKHFSLAVSKCNVPILCLMFIFGTYSLFAVILGWNVMMYLGYFLTAFCLFLSLPIVNGNRLLFLRFFKLFFLLNCLFVVWQICCINLGLTSLSMLQSNLPAQSEAGYEIPFFVKPPFIRYTGLFNESSPFSVYLMICMCFFKALGKDYKGYFYVTLFLILLGGAKIGYLFLIIYSLFFVKSKLIKIAALSLFIIVAFILVCNFDLLMEFSHGEVRSIMSRMSSFEDSRESELTLFGSGIKTSSNGKVGLDMFSILTSGFGLIGSIAILLSIIGYYWISKSPIKKYMILPFIMAALGSGSLLILQYSLMAYCLSFKPIKQE